MSSETETRALPLGRVMEMRIRTWIWWPFAELKWWAMAGTICLLQASLALFPSVYRNPVCWMESDSVPHQLRCHPGIFLERWSSQWDENSCPISRMFGPLHCTLFPPVGRIVETHKVCRYSHLETTRRRRKGSAPRVLKLSTQLDWSSC